MSGRDDTHSAAKIHDGVGKAGKDDSLADPKIKNVRMHSSAALKL